MQEKNLTKSNKEAKPMRGQGSLAVILLAFLALGAGIFFFTNIGPSSSQEGQPSQPVTDPIEYVEKARLGTPTQTAQDTLKSVLEAAGVPQTGAAGTVTSQPGYVIIYLGPSQHVSWAEFSIEITANTADGVTSAKAAAEQWLLDQGFKPEDLCGGGVVVVFYLSPEASKAMQDAGQTFSRVPSFCQ